MRTWEDYKNHVKAINEEERHNMEEIEEVSEIVSSIIWSYVKFEYKLN